MKARLKSIGIWCAGWFFILLGIAGLFLPILQGILFILVGLFILSKQSPWAARLLHKLKDRFPAVSKVFDEAKVKAMSMQARLFGKKEKEAKDLD